MKIVHKDWYKLCELPVGSTFEFGDGYYMKTTPFSDFKTLVVNLETGVVSRNIIPQTTQVRLIKAELHIL